MDKSNDRTRRSPARLEVLLCALGAVAMLTVAGCGSPQTPDQNVGADPNTIRMDDTRFLPRMTTIRPGEKITLVAASFAPHIIANGTWDNNAGRPEREPGAPAIDVRIDGGQSAAVGPFLDPGTYELYCTIHPGMDLTVKVAG